MKPVLLRALVLLAAGFAVGVTYNQVSPRGIDLNQHPLQRAAELPPSAFLDLASARAKFEAGKTFIDARAEDFYLVGHVRGALSLPVTEFDSAFAAKERALPPRDREIVCYCSGFGCEESIELAKKLRERGFERVYVFLGGWPEWSESKLPSEGIETP